MKIGFLIFTLCMSLSPPIIADTAAILGEDNRTESFATVVPNVPIVLPTDHLAHPNFRIEWWYFTANVWDQNNKHYGLQFTLFRQALEPTLSHDASPWSSRQSWMAHSAISSNAAHNYEERFSRGGIGQAGVRFNNKKQFEVWIDDWRWLGRDQDPVNGTLDFSIQDQRVSLKLSGDDSWVKHGENGFSQKSAQQASYYYTHPSIDVTGKIELKNGEQKFIKGSGWLDREWSSQFLSQQQKGWDWFSLQLDDGSRLMLFQLRDTNDNTHYKSGTWIDSDGSKTVLEGDRINIIPLDHSLVNGKQVPTKWKLTLADIKRSWTIEALYKNSWLDTLYPYWEGPINVYSGESKVGVGFLEMTGY